MLWLLRSEANLGELGSLQIIKHASLIVSNAHKQIYKSEMINLHGKMHVEEPAKHRGEADNTEKIERKSMATFEQTPCESI